MLRVWAPPKFRSPSQHFLLLLDMPLQHIPVNFLYLLMATFPTIQWHNGRELFFTKKKQRSILCTINYVNLAMFNNDCKILRLLLLIYYFTTRISAKLPDLFYSQSLNSRVREYIKYHNLYFMSSINHKWNSHLDFHISSLSSVYVAACSKCNTTACNKAERKSCMQHALQENYK